MSATETQQPCAGLMIPAEPQDEHAWLHKLVGEWTVEETAAESGQPYRGTEIVRSLGNLWVVAEGHGHIPGGGQAKTLMTLGYDPQKGRYVGTWVGSMMTHLWVYDGEVDAGRKVLTLNTLGPATDNQPPGKFKDVIEFVDDDHRTLTGCMLGEDGNWRVLMTSHYRRK
jgi:hypothetical protein